MNMGEALKRHVFLRLARIARNIFFDTYADDGAMKLLNEWKPAHAAPLVQIAPGGNGETVTQPTSALQEVSGD